jgi:hypothetical protein
VSRDDGGPGQETGFLSGIPSNTTRAASGAVHGDQLVAEDGVFGEAGAPREEQVAVDAAAVRGQAWTRARSWRLRAAGRG